MKSNLRLTVALHLIQRSVAYFVRMLAGVPELPADENGNNMKSMLTGRQTKVRWCTTLIVVCLLSCFAVLAEDIHLPLLKTKTDTYTNVTVMRVTSTQVFMSHSRGMGNIKISTIDDEDTLRALGLKVEPKKSSVFSGTNSTAAVAMAKVNAELETLKKIPAAAPVVEKLESLRSMPLPKYFFVYVSAGLLALHLLYSACVRLICVKAASDPGFLVWVPLFQWIPMFRAARMSGWWLVGLCVPVFSLIPFIIWCFKIATARGKGALVGIALLLPVTNFFAFLYLAFSGGSAPEDDGPQKLGGKSIRFAEA